VSDDTHGRSGWLPSGTHHLLLCFTEDGSVDFSPDTDNPIELAEGFAELI
jgi:hypothetical protein